MAAIEISHDVFNKYHTNGKLRLTTGYVQECLEKQGYPGHDGIVQLSKGKADQGEQMGHAFTYRVRICDGVFMYNCLISAEIDEQIERDAENLVEGTIIAITGLTVYSQGEGVKASFLITGYKVLSRYHEALSAPEMKPRSHSGNPEDHLGYRPNIVIEDVWPEAEGLAGDFQENLTNPPAAKAAKRESGDESSFNRAPAPEPTRRAVPPPARKVPSKSETGIMPIAMITPYVSNIKIYGVVSRKEEIRTFPAKNTRVFNFELTDSNGDTIRITAFNDAAESFSALITENMSYYVSNGSVRTANKQFNNTGHDYELTLRNDSTIEAGGELIAAPKVTLKRVQLSAISGHCGNLIDVLAVVEKMDAEATAFTSKAGKELVKREMELIDESQALVKLTLWGEDAKRAKTEDYVHKVVGFKGVIPREFGGGYSLSTGSGTRIIAVPQVDGVGQLYDWYTTERPNAELKSISVTSGGAGGEPPRPISMLQEMQFGKDSEKGEYVSVKGMITRINPTNVLYKGCPNEGCQKKLTDMGGDFRCEKCGENVTKFKWLYMMTFEISDETGQMFVTAFGDNAAKVAGKPASELGDLTEAEITAHFETVQFFPKMFRLRCKMETYNEEVRQKFTLFGVEDVNHDKYIEQLEQFVEQMEASAEHKDEEEGGF